MFRLILVTLVIALNLLPEKSMALRCESLLSLAARSPLLNELLKLPLRQEDRLSDLTSESRSIGISVFANSSQSERIALLKNFEIKKIVAAPGHRVLREGQKKIEELEAF